MEYKPRRKIDYDKIDEIIKDETICKKTMYNIKNHDKIKEYNRNYYLMNRAKLIKAISDNNKKNKERHCEYNKKSKMNKMIKNEQK